MKQLEQANHLLPLVAAALLERRSARAAMQEEQRRAKAKEKANARAAAKAAKHD